MGALCGEDLGAALRVRDQDRGRVLAPRLVDVFGQDALVSGAEALPKGQGAPEAAGLSEAERRICAELAPALRREGLFFVGIDVIDGRLSEINVTSPTGVREVERLGGVPLADLTIARLLAGPAPSSD